MVILFVSCWSFNRVVLCFLYGLIRVLIFCGVKIVFLFIKIFCMGIVWFSCFWFCCRGWGGGVFFSFLFLGIFGMVGWGRGWRKRLWFGFGWGFFSDFGGFGGFWVFWVYFGWLVFKVLIILKEVSICWLLGKVCVMFFFIG